jgi:O-antigen/teichoic acid export membrane protein
MPGLARPEAGGQHSEHCRLYHQSFVALILPMTPIAILLALVARPFLLVWLGSGYAARSTDPFLIALVGVWANGLAGVPNSYLLSSGRTKTVAYGQLAELPPYLVATWLFTLHFGLIGAAAVWSARFTLDALINFIIVRRVSSLSASPLPHRRWRSLFAPAALGVATLSCALVTHGLAVLYCVGNRLGRGVRGPIMAVRAVARGPSRDRRGHLGRPQASSLAPQSAGTAMREFSVRNVTNRCSFRDTDRHNTIRTGTFTAWVASR